MTKIKAEEVMKKVSLKILSVSENTGVVGRPVDDECIFCFPENIFTGFSCGFDSHDTLKKQNGGKRGAGKITCLSAVTISINNIFHARLSTVKEKCRAVSVLCGRALLGAQPRSAAFFAQGYSFQQA